MQALLGAKKTFGLLESFLARQRSQIANRLIPSRSRKGSLLDIGCGAYPYFLLHTEFARKVGLDRLVDPAVREDYLKHHQIELISFDFETTAVLPFPDKSFDAVTLLAVFEHIEPSRLSAMLCEIHRVLKPRGLLVLTTPASWADALLKFMARLKLISPVLFAEHKDTYTPAKIKAILQEAGFLGSGFQSGYFECFLNIWVRAEKEND